MHAASQPLTIPATDRHLHVSLAKAITLIALRAGPPLRLWDLLHPVAVTPGAYYREYQVIASIECELVWFAEPLIAPPIGASVSAVVGVLALGFPYPNVVSIIRMS